MDMTTIINESFSQYAGAVLQSRALVDVRDFLKPSTRQILYCLYTDGFLPNKPFKKTLKAIGSVARMYIHGDSSAEGIIMRSGQPFAMRYPLIEIDGNEGTLIQSGNWAAPRYTSSRLSPFSTCLFEDVNKDTINIWRDNYDDTEKYPTVLPTKGFYNIVNGTLGIGIGAASSIPQFNLKDVNKALETLLLNPDCSFDEIYCPPDFATGAYLINEEEVKESLKNGTGSSCKLRAKMEFDDNDNCLVVTEIPYGVYTNTICKELEAILEGEDNPGIDRFNDLTGTTPNIKIYLKKGANIKKVTSYLYKNTSLQSYYSINMTMLDDGRFPMVFSWKDALLSHIAHESEVYRNGFKFDWNKIHNKIHIINGLLICLASIDEVVATIKHSNSTAEASKALQENFKLDAEQAKAVLDMKLSRLAHLEVEKLKNEKEELQKELDRLTAILNDTNLFNQELINGWRKIANKYGDEHRTKIISISEEEEKEEMELPNPEEVVVIVSQNNGVRRIPAKNFKVQKRNGKGVKSEDEAILDTISTNTIDILMCFTDKGRMYKILVDEVPEGNKFFPISGLTALEGEEKVIAVNSLFRKSKAQYVVFFTKNGLVKKTRLEEYMKMRCGKGIAAIKLADNDSIANVVFMDEEDAILVTKQGMSIRFETKSIAPIGRVSMGVKGIKLNDGDEVICGIPVKDNNASIAIVTDIGLAKKTSIREFTPQGRGGKGIIAYKLSDTSGKIVSAMSVTNEDSVLLIGKPSSICIAATDIPELGRASSGNMMIKSSHIVCAIKM